MHMGRSASNPMLGCLGEGEERDGAPQHLVGRGWEEPQQRSGVRPDIIRRSSGSVELRGGSEGLGRGLEEFSLSILGNVPVWSGQHTGMARGSMMNRCKAQTLGAPTNSGISAQSFLSVAGSRRMSTRVIPPQRLAFASPQSLALSGDNQKGPIAHQQRQQQQQQQVPRGPARWGGPGGGGGPSPPLDPEESKRGSPLESCDVPLEAGRGSSRPPPQDSPRVHARSSGEEISGGEATPKGSPVGEGDQDSSPNSIGGGDGGGEGGSAGAEEAEASLNRAKESFGGVTKRRARPWHSQGQVLRRLGHATAPRQQQQQGQQGVGGVASPKKTVGNSLLLNSTTPEKKGRRQGDGVKSPQGDGEKGKVRRGAMVAEKLRDPPAKTNALGILGAFMPPSEEQTAKAQRWASSFPLFEHGGLVGAQRGGGSTPVSDRKPRWVARWMDSFTAA